MSRIAILGLGRMGAAIADRVEQSGHDLSVWNRSAAATEPYGARGVRVLENPAGAWGHADLVITMLSDGPAVEEVALARGLIAAAGTGAVYMDMSTIGADSSARIAQAAQAKGVPYLRAPVTGNPAVVTAGNLGIIVSGPKATFDELRDTLADIGPNLFHVGDEEQARIVKLAVNLMIAGTAQLLAEAVVLAGSYGVDRRGLLDVVGGSVMGSPFVKYKTDALVADDYRSTFTTRLLFKDLTLAIDAANAAGVPLPLTANTQQLTQACISTGMGDLDFMALLPRLRREAGLNAFASDDAPAGLTAVFHVQHAADVSLHDSGPYAAHCTGHRRADLVGKHVGAVHTGFALCECSGVVATHVHSIEESFYILSGNAVLTIDGHPRRLAADECGLVPVGVPHAWSVSDGQTARWLEVHSPAPRIGGPPDLFFTGEPVLEHAGESLDIRDPRCRTFFRLGPGQMDLDNLKLGSAVDAPTVSASMATALLAYSGIAVKMLVDGRLGAVLHSMFMVEYQPGGVAAPHDHPLEEAYYILEGEVEAVADDERLTLREGDIFWTSVGCIHAFYNTSDGRVRWLETQAPQLPPSYSYRFNRDWDYLTERLAQQTGDGIG